MWPGLANQCGSPEDVLEEQRAAASSTAALFADASSEKKKRIWRPTSDASASGEPGGNQQQYGHAYGAQALIASLSTTAAALSSTMRQRTVTIRVDKNAERNVYTLRMSLRTPSPKRVE
ncbi:hypothetical protein MRX96_005307 [Rhipicephalus microplus]